MRPDTPPEVPELEAADSRCHAEPHDLSTAPRQPRSAQSFPAAAAADLRTQQSRRFPSLGSSEQPRHRRRCDAFCAFVGRRVRLKTTASAGALKEAVYIRLLLKERRKPAVCQNSWKRNRHHRYTYGSGTSLRPRIHTRPTATGPALPVSGLGLSSLQGLSAFSHGHGPLCCGKDVIMRTLVESGSMGPLEIDC